MIIGGALRAVSDNGGDIGVSGSVDVDNTVDTEGEVYIVR